MCRLDVAAMAIIETFPMLRVDSFQLLERGGQQALRDEQLAAGGIHLDKLIIHI